MNTEKQTNQINQKVMSVNELAESIRAQRQYALVVNLKADEALRGIEVRQQQNDNKDLSLS
jgi:hypothetical protein